MADLAGYAWVIDGIVALMLAEGVALVWWHRRTGRGPGVRAVIALLGAGAAMALALRAAVSGAPLWVMGGLLALSFVAHLTDLAGRLGIGADRDRTTP